MSESIGIQYAKKEDRNGNFPPSPLAIVGAERDKYARHLTKFVHSYLTGQRNLCLQQERGSIERRANYCNHLEGGKDWKGRGLGRSKLG